MIKIKAVAFNGHMIMKDFFLNLKRELLIIDSYNMINLSCFKILLPIDANGSVTVGYF